MKTRDLWMGESLSELPREKLEAAFIGMHELLALEQERHLKSRERNLQTIVKQSRLILYLRQPWILRLFRKPPA